MRAPITTAITAAVLGLGLGLGLGGCARLASTFACEASSECLRGGALGTCEPDGACSFPDPSCPSGRRYAELSPAGGTCVGGGGGDGGDALADGPGGDAAARTTDGLVALYTFSRLVEGKLADTSGVAPALDLTIFGDDVALIDGALILSDEDDLATSYVPASKVVSACEDSGELTVEAWVLPAADKDTETGTITGLMLDFQTRNVQLAEDNDRYRQWLRSSATAGTGEIGDYATATGTVEPTITHVVVTRASDGERYFWLDGVEAAHMSQPGTFEPWSGYPLVVGNNPAGTDDYEGRIELVAYYCRALTAADVAANFAVGPDVGDD